MVLLLMAIGVVAPLPSDSARSQEKDPHNMTSQGVISERVRGMYAQEIEACYRESGQIAELSPTLGDGRGQAAAA
jgi:hypothetical protein